MQARRQHLLGSLSAAWSLCALIGGTAAGAPEPSAQLDYARHCSGCHLISGEGIAGEVPALKDFVGYFLRSPEGRAYLPRVPGVAYSPLSTARLAALLNWVLDKFSATLLPAQWRPYTTAEVEALRARPLTDPAVERAQVLQGLVASDQLPPSARMATDAMRRSSALTR